MKPIRVSMHPDGNTVGNGVSGIHTVIRAYHKIAPLIDVTFVDRRDDYDISIVHAGMLREPADIAMLHGIYFTGEYTANAWEWKANRSVIESIVSSHVVTVPSNWVAETIRKDFKIDPYILEHGIFIDDWKPFGKYKSNRVLWAKNRAFEDVCDPTPVSEIARAMPDTEFVTTFADDKAPANVTVVGLQNSQEIKKLVSGSAIVLSTIKETWGILYIEALAAGVPVVSVDGGHVPNLIRHGVGGYCYRSGDLNDMKRGIEWTLKHRDILAKNARNLAELYAWEKTAKNLRLVIDVTLEKKNAYT